MTFVVPIFTDVVVFWDLVPPKILWSLKSPDPGSPSTERVPGALGPDVVYGALGWVLKGGSPGSYDPRPTGCTYRTQDRGFFRDSRESYTCRTPYQT